MPSSHRRQDKTVSSRRRRRCELSWRQSQTVFSSPQYIGDWKFCPVSSAVWMHLWTSLAPVSKYEVTIGNHIGNCKLGQDKARLSSQRISRLDKTVSEFSVSDSLNLSLMQFTPRMPTRQDKTCQCRRCELDITRGRWTSFCFGSDRPIFQSGPYSRVQAV